MNEENDTSLSLPEIQKRRSQLAEKIAAGDYTFGDIRRYCRLNELVASCSVTFQDAVKLLEWEKRNAHTS